MAIYLEADENCDVNCARSKCTHTFMGEIAVEIFYKYLRKIKIFYDSSVFMVHISIIYSEQLPTTQCAISLHFMRQYCSFYLSVSLLIAEML